MHEILKSEVINITGGLAVDYITMAAVGITATTLLIWGNFYFFPTTQHHSYSDHFQQYEDIIFYSSLSA